MARSKIRRLKDTLDRYSEALHASRRRGAELIACADKLGRRVDSLEYGNAKLEEELRLAKEALAKADDYIASLDESLRVAKDHIALQNEHIAELLREAGESRLLKAELATLRACQGNNDDHS